MRIHSAVLDLLFPRKCIFCNKLLNPGEHDLCDECAGSAPEFGSSDEEIPGITRWTAVWSYEDMVRKALLDYKFNGKQHYSAIFGRALADKITGEFPGQYDLITYVPVSFRRKLKRGYDQVHLLAKAVARELGKKPASTLKKIRHNRAQSSLEDRRLRSQNVKGVYTVKDPGLIAGKSILLIDDIITTGSTIAECARVLLAAGAAEVLCIAVAAGQGRNG